MKTIYKPWGREEWLELNDRYCYKRIYINAGHRTSFQYHEYKVETNYIIEGTAEVWLENDDGEIDIRTMGPGEYITVIPPRKHRVIALTDLILQEVSTPEVDDIFRIEDDAHRGDGPIAHERVSPALCILTAGRGTRLDHLSEITNKALLPLRDKAIISHIIEKVPLDYDIVIAIGYKGQMVREYCEAAHYDRNLIFVDVENYDGTGSGPGLSFLACREHLQRPFYLSTADCIVEEGLPSLEHNWMGVYPTSIPELYSTAKVDEDGRITAFTNKTARGYEHAFIGLCGIRDYKTFFKELEYNIRGGELVAAFDNLSTYDGMQAEPFTWHDTGTIDGYLRAKEHFKSSLGLEKTGSQMFYKVNGRVIKTNTDKDWIRNIIARADTLRGLVPSLKYTGEYTFAYDWINGNTPYDLQSYPRYKGAIDWCFDNLWERSDGILNHTCKLFYKDKTYARLHDFLKGKPSEYKGAWHVNDVYCQPIYDILDTDIDWDWLSDGEVTEIFHGDLQFDNIIQTLDGDYKLIDWRDSFGGEIIHGDMTYDLAKLYGGMVISYADMKYINEFALRVEGDRVSYINHDERLMLVKNYYEDKLFDMGLLDKVKTLTALIHLNMAPMHPGDTGKFLFFHALKELNELS